MACLELAPEYRALLTDDHLATNLHAVRLRARVCGGGGWRGRGGGAAGGDKNTKLKTNQKTPPAHPIQPLNKNKNNNRCRCAR